MIQHLMASISFVVIRGTFDHCAFNLGYNEGETEEQDPSENL